MKERPILFSGEMVCAILAGRKTQTRRIVKPQPVMHDFGPGGIKPAFMPPHITNGFLAVGVETMLLDNCAYLKNPPYVVGFKLWVKETHRFPSKENPRVRVEYRADMSSWGIADSHDVSTNTVVADAKLFPARANEYSKQPWRPSIFMPRWASRLALEVVGVRVERLNDISPADCRAEGEPAKNTDVGVRYGYGQLWEKINGAGSWAENPWVWVIEFRRLA